ncbi:DUF6681 family protein [Lapidilactobacillus mulanensis]|uniref:DUF6681 family protein n=1 Tax=Lapidilactobacillus mulanensis TaxID=2485999 RepID=A0ABW4DNF5_9LACO|nr:DUF6681 family protein [Lapidilactobacillus mulanensis]
MLTALEIANKVLGYFNIKDKPKNRMFTLIGFFANFYLLYLAITNMRYAGYRLIGLGFLAAFLLVFYFEVLNYFYYFTDKRFKFDVSPWIEKKLGGHPANAATTQPVTFAQNVPSAGLFDRKQVLPVELNITFAEQQHIDDLAQELITQGYLSLNYNGLTDRDLYAQAQQSHERLFAMGTPLQLPFYEIKNEHGHLVLYAGVNALSEQAVGDIRKVGLTNADLAQEKYDLVVANSFLRGGPYKIAGRGGLIENTEPYEIVAEVAYQPKKVNQQ